MQSITDIYGSIDQVKAKEAGYQIEPGDAWLSKDVDVLIPAALEGQITSQNVDQISEKVKIIAEGANGPTMPDADDMLIERKVFIIPDFLCNAGGVIVSYFEGVQNDMNYYWSRDEVLSRLDEKITNAFDAVMRLVTSEGFFTRDAAYVVAINRVVEAMRFRGWL